LILIYSLYRKNTGIRPFAECAGPSASSKQLFGERLVSCSRRSFFLELNMGYWQNKLNRWAGVVAPRGPHRCFWM
jgi:hypothetical protein